MKLTYSKNRLRSKRFFSFFFSSFFLSSFFFPLLSSSFSSSVLFSPPLGAGSQVCTYSNRPTNSMFPKVFLNFDMTSYNFLYEYFRFGETYCSFTHSRKDFSIYTLIMKAEFFKLLIPIKIYDHSFRKAVNWKFSVSFQYHTLLNVQFSLPVPYLNI